MKIRVLVVDDFPLLREAFAAALQTDPAIEVVGEAGNGNEALEAARSLQPDVVMLDLHMPGLGGMAVLERLGTELPEVRVLVVTATEKADVFLEAISAGAAGYLTKRATRQELVQAVITVHGGGAVIMPSLANHLVREYSNSSRGSSTGRSRPVLAGREQEVLRLLTEGLTDREIGDRLFISPRTVQNHLTRIREKTGLHRRSELARWAVEHTWV